MSNDTALKRGHVLVLELCSGCLGLSCCRLNTNASNICLLPVQEEIRPGRRSLQATQYWSVHSAICSSGRSLVPWELITQSALITPAGPQCRYTTLLWLIPTVLSDTRRKRCKRI